MKQSQTSGNWKYAAIGLWSLIGYFYFEATRPSAGTAAPAQPKALK